MDFSIGQVIYSKAGRDKRRPFIIVDVSGEYLYLADGKLRTVSKPKKKKKMHVQHTNIVVNEIAELIKSEKELLDSDIRKALKEINMSM